MTIANLVKDLNILKYRKREGRRGKEEGRIKGRKRGREGRRRGKGGEKRGKEEQRGGEKRGDRKGQKDTGKKKEKSLNWMHPFFGRGSNSMSPRPIFLLVNAGKQCSLQSGGEALCVCHYSLQVHWHHLEIWPNPGRL